MSTLTRRPALGMRAQRSHKSAGRRAGRLVAGVVLALCSLAVIGAGAFAAFARSERTYVDLGAHGHYRTNRYVLTTDGTNWHSQLLGWAGSVRLEVASADQKPIFVGVAPANAVDRYLSGTSYTTVGDRTRTDHEGGAPTSSPTEAILWTAQAEGAGTQTLRWNATDRPQIVVAMNTDRSRPVRVRIMSSAVTLDRMPWWVPTTPLILGLLLLLVSVMMIRRRHTGPTASRLTRSREAGTA